MIEHGSRLAGDAEKLSVARCGTIDDLLREADYWAAGDGRAAVIARRTCSARSTPSCTAPTGCASGMQEEIRRGHHAHRHRGRAGRPGQRTRRWRSSGDSPSAGRAASPRACASARGEVVDIEREVELGGPIHSKGVLILSGFLAGRYAANTAAVALGEPGVRASLRRRRGRQRLAAPSCTRCSRRSPTRRSSQSLAVTGSVNQHGAGAGRSAASTRRSRGSSTSAARAASPASRAC